MAVLFCTVLPKCEPAQQLLDFSLKGLNFLGHAKNDQPQRNVASRNCRLSKFLISKKILISLVNTACEACGIAVRQLV